MTRAAASVETHVTQMLVHAAAQRDAPDRDQTLSIVHLEEDSEVANPSPQHTGSPPDRGDASPAWLDAEVTEQRQHGRPRVGRQTGVLPIGRRPQLDPVVQAAPSRAMFLDDLVKRDAWSIELAARFHALPVFGVVLVFHELGNEHVLDWDDRREGLAVTLDHEAVAAIRAAADDLGQLLSELARGHGLGVSEVVVCDAVFEVVGHGVTSRRFAYTHESLSTWYTTAPRAASPRAGSVCAARCSLTRMTTTRRDDIGLQPEVFAHLFPRRAGLVQLPVLDRFRDLAGIVVVLERLTSLQIVGGDDGDEGLAVASYHDLLASEGDAVEDLCQVGAEFLGRDGLGAAEVAFLDAPVVVPFGRHLGTSRSNGCRSGLWYQEYTFARSMVRERATESRRSSVWRRRPRTGRVLAAAKDDVRRRQRMTFTAEAAA